MLRQEMDLGYFHYIHRPGEKLGVLDNHSDFEACAERTHCNATHANLAPKVVWDEAEKRYRLDDADLEERLSVFRDTIKGRRHSILSGAEHNNVYFPGFYHYRENIPDALMQKLDGSWLELRDPDILGGKPIPMPAIDDPQLLALYEEQLSRQAANMAGCHHVAAYVMGAEMLYPEYFSLGNGDYRPVSWRHFESWCASHGFEAPANKEDTLVPDSEARRHWLAYREQAMADRASIYYQAILDKDSTHLCYYPTHGSALHGSARSMLSQQPDTLASACDGIEMGHILIDNDAERRNVIMTTFNTSYGAPVIVPRLGNKTPDLSAAGGGRSFTPETLRRLVYEDVGMGISIIYPIHWRSHLHDGEWFIKNTPAEQTCREVFDEITLAAPYLMGMGRMQPTLGVLAGDETWLKKWNMRWTAFMQDALSARLNAAVITDKLVEADLKYRMPVILVLDQSFMGRDILSRLLSYMDAGGKVLLWGSLNGEDEALSARVLEHANLRVSQAPALGKARIIREMFLTGAYEGTFGVRYRVHPVDFEALYAEIQALSPETVFAPFRVQGSGEVNAYVLTDRWGLGCVLINNSLEEQRVSVMPDARLMPQAHAVDMLTGQAVTGSFTLPGGGTRLIYFSPSPALAFDDERIAQAEDAYEAWKRGGFEVGPVRHNYASMRSGIHKAKRLCLAEALLHSLALQCKVTRTADGLTVRALPARADGSIPSDARVWMRIAPGEYRHTPLTWDGEAYTCFLPTDKLPRRYHADTQTYEVLSGPARIIVQAETADRQGGSILNVRI